MESLTAQNLGFQLFNRLFKTVDNNIGAMLVFDHDGRLIWQSEDTSADLAEKLVTRLDLQTEPVAADHGIIYADPVVDNQATGLIHLKDARGSPALTIAVQLNNSAENGTLRFDSSMLMLLKEGLLEWYIASLKFARQEDELNQMTEELTRRYEELNLIYNAEDRVHSIYHGRQLLTRLVNSTPAIISAELAVVAMPGRDLTIVKFNNDSPLENSEQMISCLRASIFEQLVETAASLVINHKEEAIKRNLQYSLAYKFVVCPLVNGEDETIGLFALVRDDTYEDFDNSDRNLLEVLANKASKIVQYNFDPLTGLENSRSFELMLSEALDKRQDDNAAGVIAYVNIDKMLVVNDIAGRDGGDRLIKDIGLKITNRVHTGDTVARLGGDKFGVYLHDCEVTQAQQLMRDLANQVKEIKFVWENKLHEVSISVGIAPFDSSLKSSSELINAAESALEAGRKLGPDRITVCKPGVSDSYEIKTQVQWLGRIQAALKDNDYLLYTQLIDPLDSSLVYPHHEVLVRMRGDNNEIVPPSEFLPVAEKFQLMPKIDRWVVSRTLQILGENFERPEQRKFPLSINLSGQTMADAQEFFEFTESCFDQFQVDPAAICFEITESAAIENLESARWFMARVRELGCKFALDDFGTGLSSFAYLKNLEVDFLKIDGAFVHGILSDKVSESMVSAINQVGHSMGLATVAEFVESAEIRHRLSEMGVDFAQGYGVGTPVDIRRQIEAYKEKCRSRPLADALSV